MNDGYINGYIQRTKDGNYQGNITIDGVSLEGGIEATLFKQDGKNYLWLRRKTIMEYDHESKSYRTRKREPRWEAYLEKQIEDNTVAYRGTFAFLRFKYSIVGVWDKIIGEEKQRMNFFIERLPMSKQSIINGINERRKEIYGKHNR